MERAFKGVWVPKDIWIDSTLGWTEKLMLVEIDSLDGEDGCWASNEYFAKFFSLSKERVRKIIYSLKEKGYISIELIYKKGTKRVDKRVIRMNTPMVENDHTPMVENDHTPMVENDHTPMVENDHYNNTSKNNTSKNIIEKEFSIDFDGLLSLINKHTGRKFLKINDSVRRSFIARLKEGYTKEQIKTAIINASNAQHHRENGCQHLTPEFFSRAVKLDMYGTAAAKPTDKPNDDEYVPTMSKK